MGQGSEREKEIFLYHFTRTREENLSSLFFFYVFEPDLIRLLSLTTEKARKGEHPLFSTWEVGSEREKKSWDWLLVAIQLCECAKWSNTSYLTS